MPYGWPCIDGKICNGNFITGPYLNGGFLKACRELVFFLILDADEDGQLAAAIAASLKETTAKSTFSKILATNSDSDRDSDSEFFEENYSADSEDSNSAVPSSKKYAKLLVEESSKTETNTAKVELEKSEKSEKCEDAGSSNGEIYLGKDLWRNGQNTPKNCIFWKYIVGGAPITPKGWMGVDLLDHVLL